MHTHDTIFPSVPRVVPLATLEVKAPPGNVDKTIIATLKSNGRIVARGKSRISNFDDARIILFASELSGQRGSDDYELWVTLDRDGRESWFPGFTDVYIHLQWPFRDGPWKKLTDTSIWREKQLSSPDNLLRIHYHRYGGYDEGIGLWTWNDDSNAAPIEIFEVGEDDFGLIFELDKAEYGLNVGQLRIGILPRRGGDWNLKEDENLFWNSSLGNEVYLIGTAPQIWKERPDTRQHVLSAFIDSQNCLVIQVSRPVDPGEISSENIRIVDDRNQRLTVGHIAKGDRPSISIKAITVDVLDVGRRSYSVSLGDFAGEVVASLRDILDAPELFYDDSAVLGAVYSPVSTKFRIFAPTAKSAEVVLYDSFTNNNAPRWCHPLYKAGKGVFEGAVQGDLKGKFYRYRLEGPGLSPETEVLDPYSINTVGDSRYGRITNLEETNPPDWEKYRIGPSVESPLDMVIYEMHVRDFTIADNSGVANKGLYLGFAEAGTRLPGDPLVKTGLDHLSELGITHVQLLPVQDFSKDADEAIYNWGYMTIAFNSPEGWYATQSHDDSKIREFKQLISALHARNIGVIMDVVYNHTDYSSPFHIINAQYYYRFFPDGKYSNGSGVGNDFRSENPMARKYIIDSLKYWVAEYGVDGFRFDLMALIDYETMRQAESELRKIKPGIILYGEPWSSGFSPMRGQPTDKNAIRNANLGAFNDHFRNALGGSPNGSEFGFIQNGSCRDKIVLGVEGSYRDWAPHPAQSINYMTCHDNLVLYDKLRWFSPAASEQEILDMMKLGYLLLLTAQGIPFIHGGEEFARSKYGHGDSYNAGDDINRIDWSLKLKNHQLFTYTRDLILLRKQHPVFRLRTVDEIRERLKFHLASNEKTLVYIIDGAGLENETWREACVLINGEDFLDVELPLPDGRWFIALDHQGAVEESDPIEHRISVRRKSGLMLYRKEEILDIAQTIPEVEQESPKEEIGEEEFEIEAESHRKLDKDNNPSGEENL